MFPREFTDLRRKRSKLLGLPDQLNYAIPVDDFTIALKDGAFLSTFECAGLDRPEEWRAAYAGAFDWGPDVGREVVEECRRRPMYPAPAI
jgi:hypothetical protein